MILLDYSQIIIGAITSNFRNFEMTSNDDTKGLLRHISLNAILNYRKQFKKYGELVICCDGRNYWRKDFFPYYKGNRKKARDESKVDWKFIYEFMDEMRQELVDTFIYPVIRQDGAEADDVIAVISKWTQTNKLVANGLFEEPEPVMIVSSDQDFFQLQKYQNVKQYSPIKKKLIKPECSPKQYLIEHIVKASDDGIPNLLSNDDVFMEGIRQTPVKKATLDHFIGLGESGCRNETEKRNWKRNQTLVDFDFIPDHISSKIVDAYINYEMKGSRNKIMNFLIKHKCKQLVGSLGEF